MTVTLLPELGGGLGSGDGAGAPPAFMVVATDTAHKQVEAWLRKHAAAAAAAAAGGGAAVSLTDVTGGYALLSLQGPHSRALQQRACAEDLSPAAHPYRAARYIDIGCARVLATRVTYVGELGYELAESAACTR